VAILIPNIKHKYLTEMKGRGVGVEGRLNVDFFIATRSFISHHKRHFIYEYK
jgi:hypothetical protein